VAGNGDVGDEARLHRSGKAYPREMLGAAEFIGFDQHLPPGANLRLEMTA
jgi:hypothetical protein